MQNVVQLGLQILRVGCNPLHRKKMNSGPLATKKKLVVSLTEAGNHMSAFLNTLNGNGES